MNQIRDLESDSRSHISPDKTEVPGSSPGWPTLKLKPPVGNRKMNARPQSYRQISA